MRDRFAHVVLRAAGLALAVALAACGESSPLELDKGGEDAGATPDAGALGDASVPGAKLPDAGAMLDAGMEPEAFGTIRVTVERTSTSTNASQVVVAIFDQLPPAGGPAGFNLTRDLSFPVALDVVQIPVGTYFAVSVLDIDPPTQLLQLPAPEDQIAFSLQPIEVRASETSTITLTLD